jgi:hypothetical protein
MDLRVMVNAWRKTASLPTSSVFDLKSNHGPDQIAQKAAVGHALGSDPPSQNCQTCPLAHECLGLFYLFSIGMGMFLILLAL